MTHRYSEEASIIHVICHNMDYRCRHKRPLTGQAAAHLLLKMDLAPLPKQQIQKNFNFSICNFLQCHICA